MATQEKSEVPLLTRRMLVGPRSHPPFCRTKCMKCTPCIPILVTSGSRKPEYKEEPAEPYPQAWKCTCHKKLYDP